MTDHCTITTRRRHLRRCLVAISIVVGFGLCAVGLQYLFANLRPVGRAITSEILLVLPRASEESVMRTRSPDKSYAVVAMDIPNYFLQVTAEQYRLLRSQYPDLTAPQDQVRCIRKSDFQLIMSDGSTYEPAFISSLGERIRFAMEVDNLSPTYWPHQFGIRDRLTWSQSTTDGVFIRYLAPLLAEREAVACAFYVDNRSQVFVEAIKFRDWPAVSVPDTQLRSVTDTQLHPDGLPKGVPIDPGVESGRE